MELLKNGHFNFGLTYLDFDCKYGTTEKQAKEIHLSAINKCIDEAEKANLESFYLEIIATPGNRKNKEESE